MEGVGCKMTSNVAVSPTVSIIVPAYNAAAVLPTCLESLLAQDYPADSYEVVVVENGSSDETVQVASAYPVQVLQSDVRGPAAARNLGIEYSTGEIVAFTDADCIAASNWLSELVPLYRDDVTAGVGGSILAYKRENPTLVERFSDEHSPLVNYWSGEAEFLPHLYTANASFRRAVLGQVGGFNPRLYTGEDVDLSWRVQLELKLSLAYQPEAIVYHQHRTTRQGLARQYRQYGFGEIMLDTLYRSYPGYPRQPGFQVRRILGQCVALSRYAISAILRYLQRADPYDLLVPQLWWLIESQNILGKLEACSATRCMMSAQHLIDLEASVFDADSFIRRYY